MGYCYSQAAGRVMDKWTEFCVKSTGSSNTWIDEKGNKYFFEITRKDQPDYGICGTIHKMIPGTEKGDSYMAKPCGSFRINGDGTIARAPKILKQFAKKPLARLW